MGTPGISLAFYFCLEFLFWLVDIWCVARKLRFGFDQHSLNYALTVTRSARLGSVIFVTTIPLAILINDSVVPAGYKVGLRAASGAGFSCTLFMYLRSIFVPTA